MKSWLFQASVRNCLNCVQNCDDHGLLDFKSAVQYMKRFIYHFTSFLHGLIRTHKWPAPNVSGFIAQLVRASHRYARSRVQTPLKSWLFQAFVRNCLNCVQNCDDHGLLDFKSAVQYMKRFIYHFTKSYLVYYPNNSIIIKNLKSCFPWMPRLEYVTQIATWINVSIGWGILLSYLLINFNYQNNW